MLSRTFGLTALAAASASAILLPPSLAAADLGDDNAMEVSVDAMKRTVAIECPTCAFAAKEGEALVWQQEAGNSFLLEFEVGDREETLDINGVQLYPPTFGYFTEPFLVTQVDPTSEDNLQLRVTGYTFHYNSAETITEAGMELLPMNFRITSIEGIPVDPPALTINLLKDATGRLMIASFTTTSAAEASAAEQDKQCKEWPLLCKWKKIVADRLNSVKSSVSSACHRHKSNPMAEDTVQGKPAHRFRPGRPHHRPQTKEGHHAHDHHHHHSHHRMHMVIRRAFFTVVIPILIGIFAGTLTYLVGMALGCLIAIVVAKVRGRAPYERIALDEEDTDDVERYEGHDEKEMYSELPEYDAPPVYEQGAEKEVVDDETK